MVTEKQITANRSNAVKSTGPKSAVGKSTVSRNAIKHGLLSEKLLLRDEAEQDYDAFQVALWGSLAPEGALEELLATKLVALAWRLRRVVWVEGEMFNGQEESISALAECFSRNNGSEIHTISRYETALEKHFYRALGELQRMQALRMEKASSFFPWS